MDGKTEYAGADWVREAFRIEPSELGAIVADLVGDVFFGIYHVQALLDKTDWTNPRWIEVQIDCDLSTVDNDLLTRLVVLAHDRMVRVSISGGWRSRLRLEFHKRDRREGAIWERYPTLEDHSAAIRSDCARSAD
ncbi:MAG: hypothetical protein ACLFU8_13110 [Anaerolineales bacterium]